MIVKNAKQIFARILKRFAHPMRFKILFLNRRGIIVYHSKEPIKKLYIKLPFLRNYNQKIENEIVDFLEDSDKT